MNRDNGKREGVRVMEGRERERRGEKEGEGMKRGRDMKGSEEGLVM